MNKVVNNIFRMLFEPNEDVSMNEKYFITIVFGTILSMVIIFIR